MVNIFDQYGIKEVADVTLYSIHKKQDGSGDNYFIPALFLDTLKISSFEKTADDVWATGGSENGRLVSWDYGKTINVTLEDALCTPASLGLCWGGVLSADWVDGHINVNSQACPYENPIERISRIEKSYYPRNDQDKNCVAKMLPHLKDDCVDSQLGLLRMSSVVDGTDISGFGMVKCHSYRWRLVIESIVNSVAQVPDRFFDVKGRAYPIDINRKVSAHSLPTYRNYKDAVIYKINTKTKSAPPLAKIIYDYAMESKGELVKEELQAENIGVSQLTLAQLLEKAGYIIHADGIVEFSETESDSNSSRYFYPLRSLLTKIPYSTKNDNSYNFDHVEILYEIKDSEIVKYMAPEIVEANALSDIKVTYAENHAMTDLCGENGQIDLDQIGSIEDIVLVKEICEADYLAIIVDNDDNYHALIGVYAQKDKNEPKDTVIWYKPKVPVDVSQFKGLDMWLRFSSINELIYFIITKYENDIHNITPVCINANNGNDFWGVDDKKTTVKELENSDALAYKGKLWAYLNPKTMKPYSDDYWFHQGEPFLVKSLTLSTSEKRISGNRIVVKAGVWPGLYMLVGETWIKNSNSHQNERMQIKIPMCKVRSNNTLSLEAAGDPVTFNLDLEVIKPRCGELMEITTYEVEEKKSKNEKGQSYLVDGTTDVILE